MIEDKMETLLTQIEGVSVIATNPHKDERGRFYRCFCIDALRTIVGKRQLKQINFSVSYDVGTIRGLHYQLPPCAEMKFVRCIKGAVFDVAVDLRAGSPTFLKWHAEVLSGENARMMVVPEGCAHGFQVLMPESELIYLHTEYYDKNSEGGLAYNDPTLSIEWPMPVTTISERDASFSLIDAKFMGLTL